MFLYTALYNITVYYCVALWKREVRDAVNENMYRRLRVAAQWIIDTHGKAN
jgi:hypothetical protein